LGILNLDLWDLFEIWNLVLEFLRYFGRSFSEIRTEPMITLLRQTRLQPSFFDSVAGDVTARTQALELGNFTDTAVVGIQTAAVEDATGGKIDGGWDFAL
jgi:hypothetical protein